MAVRSSGFIKSSFYDPRVFQDDLENIRRFYVEQGYLEAAISRVAIDSSGTRINIEITMAEGARTHLEEISISGNKEFTDREIGGEIPLKPGDPFRSPLIQKAVSNIMTRYGQRGYLSVTVTPDVRVNPELHNARVEFIIFESRRYTVQDIFILGLQKTQKYAAAREIPLKTGDIFDYSKMLLGERNLYETGLFNSVIMQPAPAPFDSSGRVLLVNLRERKSGEFALGGGWETIDGFRGTMNVQNKNLFGTARLAEFNGMASQTGYQSRLSYSQPWTFDIRLRASIAGLYEYRDDPAFDLRRYGVNAGISRRIRPSTEANIFSRIENARIENITGTLPKDTQRSNLRGIGLNVTYDTRDNMFNTLDGLFLESRNELIGTFIGGSDDFATTSWTCRYFQKYKKILFGASLQVGWKRPFGGTRIPVNELFFAGGPNIMRGFKYQELGSSVDTNGDEAGGRLLTAGSAELRFKIYRMVGMAVFLDAGNVWGSGNDFTTSKIRYDAGLGPRINTPFGIVRGDFAFKLDRRKGEKLNQFWIALGQAF